MIDSMDGEGYGKVWSVKGAQDWFPLETFKCVFEFSRWMCELPKKDVAALHLEVTIGWSSLWLQSLLVLPD